VTDRFMSEDKGEGYMKMAAAVYARDESDA
jgi:hypothetical protein